MLEIKITSTAKDGTQLGTTVRISELIADSQSVDELVTIASNGLRKVIEAYKE